MITRTSTSALAAFVLCALVAGPALGFGAGDPALVSAGMDGARLGVALGRHVGPHGEGTSVRLLARPRDRRWSLWLDARQDRFEQGGIAVDTRVETESEDTDFGAGLLLPLDRTVYGFELAARLTANAVERDIVDALVVGGRRTVGETESRRVSLSLAAGGAPLGRTALRPYGRLGAAVVRQETRLRIDGAAGVGEETARSETVLEPDVALGLALPFRRITLFGALEFREERSAVAGVRLELR